MILQDSSALNVDATIPEGLAALALRVQGRFTESPAFGTAAQIKHLATVVGDVRSAPLFGAVAHALAQRWQGHASRQSPASAVSGSAFHH